MGRIRRIAFRGAVAGSVVVLLGILGFGIAVKPQGGAFTLYTLMTAAPLVLGLYSALFAPLPGDQQDQGARGRRPEKRKDADNSQLRDSGREE